MRIHRDDFSPRPAPDPAPQPPRPGGDVPTTARARRPADRPAETTEPARVRASHDIAPLLRATAAAERAASASVAAPEQPPRRRSRRLRDYFVLLLGGNAVMAALVVYAGPAPLTLSFGAFGMIVFTSGLTWVVFGIMDPY